MCHDGRRITLIGAHLKSKAPHGARSKDEMMLISIANRRKQLAQVLWIRGRVDQPDGADTLYAGEGNDVLHIATDDVALGGGGEDEFNVHISQFVSGKPVPLIADFELTED